MSHHLPPPPKQQPQPSSSITPQSTTTTTPNSSTNNNQSFSTAIPPPPPIGATRLPPPLHTKQQSIDNNNNNSSNNSLSPASHTTSLHTPSPSTSGQLPPFSQPLPPPTTTSPTSIPISTSPQQSTSTTSSSSPHPQQSQIDQYGTRIPPPPPKQQQQQQQPKIGSSPTSNDHHIPLILPTTQATAPAATSQLLNTNLKVDSIRTDTASYAHLLIHGQTFKRVGSTLSKTFGSSERFVWFSPSLDTFYWSKNKNDPKSTEMQSKHIIYIGPYLNPTTQQTDPTLPLAFTITFRDPNNNNDNEIRLDLEANSAYEKDSWIKMISWVKENNSQISRPFNFQHTMSVSQDFQWELPDDQSLESVFQLGATLGQGTFGKVLKAQHIPSGFTVAVKLVNCASIQDVADVKREVDVLKQCRFRNIVDYYGCWGPDSNNMLWTLMDFCQFGSVIDLLVSADVYLTETQISYIIGSTLCGIHYLHGKNILHRDIKARNILISNSATVKLTDFGISKVGYQPDNNNFASYSGAGTPHWMAPELINEEPASYKSDIWSLGITAIELCTGLPPRADQNVYQVMNSTLTLPPPVLPPPPPQRPPWSKEFHDFVAFCLQKNPLQRPTAGDLLRHPFIQQGLSSPRCLDSIIDILEAPRNLSDGTILRKKGGVDNNNNDKNDKNNKNNKNDKNNPNNNNSTLPRDVSSLDYQELAQSYQYQRDAQHEQNPHGHNNNDHDDDNGRESSNTIAIGSTQELTTFYNQSGKEKFKLGHQSTILSSTFSFLIPEDKYSQLFTPQRLLFMKLYSLPPFITIVLGDSIIRGTGFQSYSSYPLKITLNKTPGARSLPCSIQDTLPGSAKLAKILAADEPSIVWRRFSDFEWLYEQITIIYPSVILPSLPDKSYTTRFDPQVLYQRRLLLQILLETLARHPVCNQSFIFHAFLTLDEIKLNELKLYLKQKIEKIKSEYKRLQSTLNTHTNTISIHTTTLSNVQQQLTIPTTSQSSSSSQSNDQQQQQQSSSQTQQFFISYSVPTTQLYQQLPHETILPEERPLYLAFEPNNVSLPFLHRLKKGSEQYNYLMTLPDVFHTRVIEQYCKELIPYLVTAETAFHSQEQQISILLQSISNVGQLFVKVNEQFQFGRALLCIHSKRLMTERLHQQNYDLTIKLQDHDIYEFCINKQRLYSENPFISKLYQSYILAIQSCSHDIKGTNSTLSLAHPGSTSTTSSSSNNNNNSSTSPTLHSIPQIRKLDIILNDLQKAETIFTPGLTLLLGKLANTYTIIQNDFLEEILRVYGGHLLQYYFQLYSNGIPTTLIRQRELLLLNAQYDTNYITATSSGNHPRLSNNPLLIQNYSDRVGLSLEVSSNETNLQHELGITTVTLPTSQNLQQLTTFLQNHFSPSIVRLEFFCKSMCEEFLLLQRQKEAHMAYASYIIAHYSKIQAMKELLMWDELVFELDILPEDETFFDLPL